MLTVKNMFHNVYSKQMLHETGLASLLGSDFLPFLKIGSNITLVNASSLGKIHQCLRTE